MKKTEKMIEYMLKIREDIEQEMGKVIIDQKDIIQKLIIALFSGGHTLIIGVPGLAKTLIVNTLAEILNLRFSRIQFTPDLMPSDITGTDIIQEEPEAGKRKFVFIKGPVFANIVLADEINRAPPKTQSALLQAMQEYEVTQGGKTYKIELPFTVVATQNPIEQEGTYPLPEAQLDRFMFSLNIDYPNFEDEVKIIKEKTTSIVPQVKKVIKKEKLVEFYSVIRDVPVSEEVIKTAVQCGKMSRPSDSTIPEVKKYVNWGVSPRAVQYLVIGAKAKAILDGRPTPSLKDLASLMHPVFDHRVVTNFVAEADGINAHLVVEEIKKVVMKNEKNSR